MATMDAITTNTIWYQEQLDAVRPQPEISILDWASQNIYLSGDTEIKGWYNVNLAPWAEAIFAFAEDPDIREIVVRKPAQIGGTIAFHIIHLYRAIVKGKSALLVYADEETAKKVLEKKLGVLIQSPKIRPYIAAEKTYTIEFTNGAHIDIAWASSVAKLATFEYPDVDADECDKKGYYLTTNEADPITNLIQRTATYYDGKVFILSTPTVEEGNVTKRLKSTDMIFDYHVPCPHCGQHQPLVFSKKYAADFDDGQYRDVDGQMRRLGQVVWEGGSKATREQVEVTAGYACGECGAIWTPDQKNAAVRNWILVPRKPVEYRIRSVGIQIWRIFSMLGIFGELSEIIWDYVKNHDDPEKLKGVINSCFAEPWRNVFIETTENEILKSRLIDLEPMTVPEEAICLTIGVDVQQGFLVYDVWAFSDDWKSWLVDYGQFPSLNELEQLIFERVYPVVGGGVMGPWRVGIDPKGGIREGERLTSTDEVYLWIRENMYRGVEIYPCLGSARPLSQKIIQGKIIEHTPSGHKLKSGIQLFHLDIDSNNISFLQSLEASRTGQGAYPAYLHSGTGNEWAKQITGIRADVDKNGTRVWKKIARHDHFDASKNARALVDFQWPRGGLNILGGRKHRNTTIRQHEEIITGNQEVVSRLRTMQKQEQGRFGGRIVNPYERLRSGDQ